MKKSLILTALLASASCVAQSTEIITSTATVHTRNRLISAHATYGLDASGTNVVLVTLNLRAATEQKMDNGNWSLVSEETTQYTRAGVSNWVETYTAANGQVVSNGIKAAFLADIGRIELLPTRYRSIKLVPQATVSINTP